MKKLLLILSLFIVVTNVSAQSVGINDDNSAPDSSAMLDVKSTDKGMLIPRVDFNNKPATPATGLLIYVTANGPEGDNAFYYYNGTAWTIIAGSGGADSDWTVSGNDMYSAVSGNIGIGTSSPNVPLSFGAGLGDKIGLYDNGSLFFGMGIQNGLMQIFSGAENTRIGLGYGNSEAFTETMSVVGDKVGIGETSPDELLTVANSIGNAKLHFDASASASVRVDRGNTNSLSLISHETNGVLKMFSGFINDGTDNYYIGKTTSNPYLTINQSTGSVGFGTKTPSALVHAYSNASSTSFYPEFVAEKGNMERPAGYGFITNGNYFHIRQETDGRLTFGTNNSTWSAISPRMTIKADGKVGVGTSDPGQKLTVNGAVESKTGGFKFPDGTVQTSAAIATVGAKSVFRVHKNGNNQSVASGVATKIEWSTIEFDTNNEYDLANNQFKPLSEGKYQLNLNAAMSNLAVGQYLAVYIYKNGSLYSTTHVYSPINGGLIRLNMSEIVDANGVNDYFEAYAYQNTGVEKNLLGDTYNTSFSGTKLD